MGQALKAQTVMRLAFHPVLKLVDDARFPYPGDALNTYHLSFTVFGIAPAFL
jgi:hypothetical protein